MSVFYLALKAIKEKWLSSLLSLILVGFGVAIITALLLLSNQFSNNLEKNAKGIDAVLGAKGSPMQLILSSIYYVDFPTGNISYEEAYKVASSPKVKLWVPLALGDNFSGYRIVGTNENFVNLYNLELQEGDFWNKDFEVTIGADIAKKKGIKVGDTIHGAHGLSSADDVHEEHPYRVTGILKQQNNVVDHLVLTNIESVWLMHGIGEEDDHHSHDHDGHAEEHAMEGKEITSMLIQYKSPVSIVTFPKYVNDNTSMQIASPAMESARLFSIVGVGVEAFSWLAYMIIFISVLSVFINLYVSLRSRKPDLVLMRTLGASRSKVFLLIILEGILLVIVGAAIGMITGHIMVQCLGSSLEEGQNIFTGFVFLKEEIYLLLISFITGILAAVFPALKAYRSDISKILSEK